MPLHRHPAGGNVRYALIPEKEKSYSIPVSLSNNGHTTHIGNLFFQALGTYVQVQGDCVALAGNIATAYAAPYSDVELFIGGHGGAAGADAVRFKIDYLECVKRLLAANGTADEFARALRAAYPELPGEAGLDALAQALYADR